MNCSSFTVCVFVFILFFLLFQTEYLAIIPSNTVSSNTVDYHVSMRQVESVTTACFGFNYRS